MSAASPVANGGSCGIASAPVLESAETASTAASSPNAAIAEPAVQRRKTFHRSCCQVHSVLRVGRTPYVKA